MGVSASTENLQTGAAKFFTIIAIISFALIVFILAVLAFASNAVGGADEYAQDFSGSWSYQWGDAPFEALDDENSLWIPVEHPSNPPDRDGERYVWFRSQLPEITFRDPVLFIYSIDTAAEVYVADRLIYQFGDFGGDSPPEFMGWPWHAIPLEEEHGGELITVRVYSDYFDIGLWGEILIGSRATMLRRMIKRDMPRIAVGIISLFMACAFLALHFTGKRMGSYLFLALSVLPVGIRVLSYTHLQQFYIASPLVTEYIRAGTYFLIPVGFTLVIADIIEYRFKTVTRFVWICSISYFVFALGLAASGVIPLHSTYLVFDFFYVAAIGALCILGIVATVGGNLEARFLTINFVVMALLSIYNILVTNSVLPWIDEINYIIMFVFSLGLGYILLRRFVMVYRELEYTSSDLGRMAANLEATVQERTLQLQEANRALEQERDSLHIDSITDSLTGLYNRRYAESQLKRMISEASRYSRKLTILLFDLDRFKNLNDSFGHVTGDEVLKTVGRIMTDNLRESDIPARYGGEEFLIILPEADEATTYSVADRIRQVIGSARWENPDVKTTISGGIAAYTSGTSKELLEKADLRLYAAKTKGRDRIER